MSNSPNGIRLAIALIDLGQTDRDSYRLAVKYMRDFVADSLRLPVADPPLLPRTLTADDPEPPPVDRP